MNDEGELQVKKPSKWQAIKQIILATNWIVYTDRASLGQVSPLYADRFIEKTNVENERLRLMSVRHERELQRLVDMLEDES